MSLNLQDLLKISFFEGLSPAELETIYQAGREYPVKQGAFFFMQGGPAGIIYVLVQGQVKMTQVGLEGQQVLVRIVAPGEEFGTIAVLSGIAYPLSAEAVEDSLAVAWDRETITALMLAHPRLALNALRAIAERFKELQERYRELATERVERRVARALLRLAQHVGHKKEGKVLLNLSLSRQDLAEMTGTTLYTVSRLLSKWEQQGLIETGREKVTIRQPQGLLLIADDLPSNPSGQEPI